MSAGPRGAPPAAAWPSAPQPCQKQARPADHAHAETGTTSPGQVETFEAAQNLHEETEVPTEWHRNTCRARDPECRPRASRGLQVWRAPAPGAP